MSEAWLEGRIAENRRWTDTLWSLRVEGVALGFKAGQFVRIALDIGGERVARAFSFVNPPQEPVLEFYGVTVPEGPLSPRLARLRAGDRLYVARNPAGFLTLEEVPQAQSLWLMATGTGIAPFLSILRTEAPWQRFRSVVLVHGVRQAGERVYRDLIQEMLRERPGQLSYVSLVSREAAAGALEGRIPAAIADGRLERAAGAALGDASHVMLCGNPGMLRDAQAVLTARGLRKHRRRAPGHISVESFW